jgi:hypothetical protein
MTELEETILLANKILDRPGGADPDDDLAMLSRQFLRSREMENRLKTLLRRDKTLLRRAADALEGWSQKNPITQPLIAELRKAAA